MTPNWKHMQVLITERRYYRVYRDDALHVQKEVITMRNNGQPGDSKSYYFIDGDPKEYKTEAEMMKAIRSRQK